MATLSVSSASELRSAINSASSGDTIQLANGSYGDVSLRGVDNITLEAQGSGAVLDGLSVRNADGVTIDGLTLEGGTDRSGYGTGTGLTIRASSDVTVQNTNLSDYSKGIQAWDVTGLTLRSNTLDNISHDGMVLGHVYETVIDGNDVTMHGDVNVDHKDVIQIYNQGSKAPASDVVISNNTLTALDENIHGIYMGNADAKSSGSSGEYYSNVTITGNVMDIQNKLGIAIGQTDGLTITDNVVLQNSGAGAARAMNTPEILVDADSRDVRVAGNTVLDTPTAATTNWQDTGISGSGWSITGNAVVSVATSVAAYLTGLSTGAGSASAAAGADDTPSVGAPSVGTETGTETGAASGTASGDEFRFVGSAIDGARSATVEGLDFGAGDTLKLGRYDAGTFDKIPGGNVVHVNEAGTYAKVDSLTDIAELAASSDRVSAHVTGDDLAVSIEQDGGTLDLVLAGLGQAYQDGYDETLF